MSCLRLALRGSTYPYRYVVHGQLVHALSLAPPLEFDLQQLLCSIAKEYLVSDWRPSIALVRRGMPQVPLESLGESVLLATISPVNSKDAATTVVKDLCT